MSAAGPRAASVAAVVVPLALVALDAATTVAVVADGGRCGTDCTGGLLSLPFAPTVTPLWLAGIGDDRGRVSTAAVAVAYVFVLTFTALWWRYVSRGAPRAWRTHPRFLLWIFFAIALTSLVKVPTLALESRGPGASILVEAILWGGILGGLRRLRGH